MPPKTSPCRSQDDMLQGKARASFMDIVVWLRSLGLGKYEAAFLQALDAADMQAGHD